MAQLEGTLSVADLPPTLFRPQAGKVFAQAEQFFFARRPLREGGGTGSRAPCMAGLPTKIRLLLF
jgi:hypothetical protein